MLTGSEHTFDKCAEFANNALMVAQENGAFVVPGMNARNALLVARYAGVSQQIARNTLDMHHGDVRAALNALGHTGII